MGGSKPEGGTHTDLHPVADFSRFRVFCSPSLYFDLFKAPLLRRHQPGKTYRYAATVYLTILTNHHAANRIPPGMDKLKAQLAFSAFLGGYMLIKKLKWLAVLVFSLVSLALIQGCDESGQQPKELLEVVETVEVNAPPEVVWAVIGGFGAMKAWHPAVQKVDHEGGLEPGAKRTLYLPDEAKIVEELLKYDSQDRSYEYRIVAVDPKVLPVIDYVSELRVAPAENEGQSLVIWTGHFNSAGNENLDQDKRDEAALGTIKAVYRGGLDNLKAIFPQVPPPPAETETPPPAETETPPSTETETPTPAETKTPSPPY